jgi:hypothetical protein
MNDNQAHLQEILPFNKDRYFEMAKVQGLTEAVNRLHHDLWEVERECFDTPDGYQPDLWKTLNQMRLFSRELWDLKLNDSTQH